MNIINAILQKYEIFDFLIKVFFSIFNSIILIVIASIVIKIFNAILKKSLKINNKLTERKKATLTVVLTSVIRYTIYFIAGCSILSSFGINIASLITVAGVGSVAIGLGAQSIIQDLLAGMFILFEDQFAVGDIITIDDLTGTVESIGIRTTIIRSADGDVHIIPNGNIKIITNMSKQFNRAKIEVSIAYEHNIDNVLNILADEMNIIFEKKLIKGLKKIPEVLGITEFAENGIIIRILADTEIGENWQIEREIRKYIKNRFDKENIAIPYPRRVIENVNKN